MKNKKFPLPGRERVGERVIAKRYPLPSIPSRRGGGIFFELFVNRSRRLFQ